MANRGIALDDTLRDYLVAHGSREHPAQTALREATVGVRGAGMQIGPEQGALLALLVRLIGARRALEVGVYTGYSALSVALALPADGRLLACDVSDEWTRIGKPYWAAAGVAERIELRLAPAVQTLDAELAAGAAASYDFAFIDADKASYDLYYERCLSLLRPGGLVAIDNVLWGGAVARPAGDDETRALQRLNDKVHADPRVDMTMLPVGDGVTLARKR